MLAVAVVGYNVTRAAQEPVTSSPGPLEIADTQLRAQLEQARKTETEAEKRDWNSPARLRAMIDGHAWRIEQLKSNKEAAEIVAYDQEAIDRLEKRIAELAKEAAEKQSEETSALDGAGLQTQ